MARTCAAPARFGFFTPNPSERAPDGARRLRRARCGRRRSRIASRANCRRGREADGSTVTVARSTQSASWPSQTTRGVSHRVPSARAVPSGSDTKRYESLEMFVAHRRKARRSRAASSARPLTRIAGCAFLAGWKSGSTPRCSARRRGQAPPRAVVVAAARPSQHAAIECTSRGLCPAGMASCT